MHIINSTEYLIHIIYSSFEIELIINFYQKMWNLSIIHIILS